MLFPVFVGVVAAAERGWQVISPERQSQEGTARAQPQDSLPGTRARVTGLLLLGTGTLWAG